MPPRSEGFAGGETTHGTDESIQGRAFLEDGGQILALNTDFAASPFIDVGAILSAHQVHELGW